MTEFVIHLDKRASRCLLLLNNNGCILVGGLDYGILNWNGSSKIPH